MNEYFFIAISTRENLELCKRYALAGFPSTLNGAWTYSEINQGDFVTFLYGARAFNLYKVSKKEAIKNADTLPPWKQLEFKSGKKAHFPFRLYLEPVRKFEETIARNEFVYIAENLLLRGGYRKTHFQADQTTLQYVSQLGEPFKDNVEQLELPPYEIFKPKFVRSNEILTPEINQLKEIILQSLIRQKFSDTNNLEAFLDRLDLPGIEGIKFEVLGEKALSVGHVDIMLKDSSPKGLVKRIVIEVKLGKAGKKEINQLEAYIKEIGEECVAGVLISEDVAKKMVKIGIGRIHFMRYEFGGMNLREPHTFEELLSSIQISPLT